jgi:hypothetical protein
MSTITIGADIDLDREPTVLPSGHRYTNADADADAAWFEDHEKRRGRPSLAHGTSPQVAFRVPPATKAQLAAIARRQGRTQAALARDALDQYLAATIG